MNKPKHHKKILIAPLNWGLGHATRCIPIINALIKEGFDPVIASDGDALLLLQKEFPQLKSYELPAYHIKYAKNGKLLKYKLLLQMPKIVEAVRKEKSILENIITKENLCGIISDNRFGLRSDKVPSVYLTHQLNVLSGGATIFTSWYHQKIIAKFDECWVPDYEDEVNLAGKLSHVNHAGLRLKYIHPLSRFGQNNTSSEPVQKAKKYDIMVLLSGPEPQRTILENRLLNAFKSTSKRLLFIRGIISDHQNEISTKNEHIKIVDFMLQEALEKAIMATDLIIARSGYSTIMDLERLKAKAFFIPTPGQFEQTYLAAYLKQQNLAPYAEQNDFHIKLLEMDSEKYGFKHQKTRTKPPFPFDVFL